MGQNFSWPEQFGQRLSTRSVTTTSRRPLQRKRKYLLLKADPRPKQNQEDHQQLTHLQGLHLFSKEYGLRLNQELYSINLTQWQKNKHSSSTRRITSKKMERSISGDWKMIFRISEIWSSEQTWILSILVWWCVGEQDGRRRRQQEKISILIWFVRTRNSLPSSCPTLFRTQSHWSFTATVSWFRIIPSSTLLMLDVRSVYTPSPIQDWYREDKM